MIRRLRHLALAAAFLFATPALAEKVTITFVQTNDIDRMEESDGRGGFARLMAVVKAERAKGPTFFVHSGDTISPSLLSGIDHGAHIIDILNKMKVDVFTPGNHEFDFGPQVFRDRMAEATFPIVTSNIREKDGRQPAHTFDHQIVEVKGIRLGFYGMTTEDTPSVSQPGDFTFANSLDTGKKEAAALRAAGADLVVAIVHTPVDVDMGLVREGAADIVLSGHDEHLLAYYNGKVALTESESQGNFSIVTHVTVDKSEKDGQTTVTWRPEFDIVDTANVEPDPEIAAIVKGYQDKLDQELKVEIGVTATPLDSRRATVRGGEAAIGNLIADAIRASVGADIAITNGGGIRADRQYDAGTKLTRADVFAELPFGNKVVKLEVTGADIVSALENGLSQVEVAAGRFPQVSGLVVKADLARPAGSRVFSVTVNGAPIEDGKTYTLATNDFMAAGGDGYTVFKSAKPLINAVDAKLMASAVIDYIAAQKEIAPKVEGRLITQ
ncbi:MAG: 5'-nucleotidase C-terminal domain-containing protein [Rhizobiales bacterium]|nr:5'-nucleotidase C-terminal domain-containing protein [Hyphomicrobiales bacterium]